MNPRQVAAIEVICRHELYKFNPDNPDCEMNGILLGGRDFSGGLQVGKNYLAEEILKVLHGKGVNVRVLKPKIMT